MSANRVMPPDIQIAVRRLFDEVSEAATADDGAARHRFEDLHPELQIAVLNATEGLIRGYANLARSS